MISVAFFEAAAIAIPALAVAVGVAGAVLMSSSRHRALEVERLRSPWAVALALGCVVTVACGEVLALVTVAADRPTMAAFVWAMAALVLLVVGLASAAVSSLVELPADSEWSGVVAPLLLFLVTATAVIASIALL